MNIKILYQSSVFDREAQMIAYSLRKAGHSVQIVTHISISANADYYILLGANDLVDVDIEQVKVNFKFNYVVYQLEQVPETINDGSKNWFAGENGAKYISILKHAINVYDFSYRNAELLKKHYDIDATVVPLWFNEGLTAKGWCISKKTVSKKYDVLFLGSENPRRTEIFNKLKSAGLNVFVANNVWRRNCQNMINSCKIFLNLHYYENANLEVSRLIQALSMGAYVVSEHSSDVILDESFKNYVDFVDTDKIVEHCVNVIKNDGWKNINKIKDYSFTFPVEAISTSTSTSTSTSQEDELPEEDLCEFAKAETVQHRQQTVGIKLPLHPEIDEMPPITLITLTHNRPELFRIALNNWYHFNYPMERVEWIIVDDSTEPMKDILPNNKQIRYFYLDPKEKTSESAFPTTIAAKRNYAVSLATNNIILHMDDDDFYYPYSLFIRTKILLTTEYQCVGCNDYGVYHLIDNYSFLLKSRYLSEASMGYYKSFWEQRHFEDHPLGEGAHFLRGRRSKVITIPFEYNIVAITHGSNYTGKFRELKGINNNEIYKSFDNTTKCLMDNVYRKIKNGS